MSNEKSCITENDDGFLSSDFSTRIKEYSKYNFLRFQGEVDAFTQIGCEAAVFEPQYLMALVENYKEKLPNDFFLKICALLKLYNEEKECLEKHIAKMKKRLDEAAKPLNRQLFYQAEVMPPYIITGEASASTSSNAGVLPIASLPDREIERRTKQTPLSPNIRGGIRSLEVRFVRGDAAISQVICHCVCGKILYGDWYGTRTQSQRQEHLTSEVHKTWVSHFLNRNADQPLRYINNRWEIDIVPTNVALQAHYSGIPRENSWLLAYKGDYFDEDEEPEDIEERLAKRKEAEIELGLRMREFANEWVGNEIVLIINPI